MKQRTQIIVLVVLILIAIGAWYWTSKGPSVSIASGDSALRFSPLSVENPGLHFAALDQSRKTDYKNSGRNIFSVIAPPTAEEIAQHNKQEQIAAEAAKNSAPLVPPPPSLPPNVKFYGYGTVPNGTARRAFLTDGEEVYIVGIGDTLLGRFKIVRINNTTLEFEEISSQKHGTAQLEEQGTPQA